MSIALIDEERTERLVFGASSPGSVYEIGSVTKVLTGSILGRMAALGRVNLNDPAQKFLGDAHISTPITLLQLATHTAGLPRLPDNLAPADPRNPYADYSEKELFAFLRNFVPTSPPGTKSLYSNAGAGILGYALTRAAHARDYDELLSTYVTGPLYMEETSTKLAPQQGYDDLGLPQPAWDFDVLAGAGAVRATLGDMERFVRGSIEGAFPLAVMSHFMLPGTEGSIGLGWHIAHNGIAWHNGRTAGCYCYVAFDPRTRRGVVVMANTSAKILDEMAVALMRAHDGRDYRFEVPKTEYLDLHLLERYVGEYRFSEDFSIKIALHHGGLFAEGTGQEPLRLFARSETVFQIRAMQAELEFTAMSDGRPNALVLRQEGASTRGQRIDVNASSDSR